MREIAIECLGSSRLTLVDDGDVVFIVIATPNDKAEGGQSFMIVGLDSEALEQLTRFVTEVNK